MTKLLHVAAQKNDEMNTCYHRLRLTITASVLLAMGLPAKAADRDAIDVAPDNKHQYLLINVRKVTREVLGEIHTKIPTAQDGRIKLGVGCIFSYLASDNDERVVASIRDAMQLAEQTETPIYIQIDGEIWWQGRPDLWNWWDPDKPSFDSDNRHNVEWTSWGSDDALKIAWLNWGRQMLMLPPPNLMSSRFEGRRHCGVTNGQSWSVTFKFNCYFSLFRHRRQLFAQLL